MWHLNTPCWDFDSFTASCSFSSAPWAVKSHAQFNQVSSAWLSQPNCGAQGNGLILILGSVTVILIHEMWRKSRVWPQTGVRHTTNGVKRWVIDIRRLSVTWSCFLIRHRDLADTEKPKQAEETSTYVSFVRITSFHVRCYATNWLYYISRSGSCSETCTSLQRKFFPLLTSID